MTIGFLAIALGAAAVVALICIAIVFATRERVDRRGPGLPRGAAPPRPNSAATDDGGAMFLGGAMLASAASSDFGVGPTAPSHDAPSPSQDPGTFDAGSHGGGFDAGGGSFDAGGGFGGGDGGGGGASGSW